MFFVLSKILAVFLSPILWIYVLLVWAFFKKDITTTKKILVITVLAFYFFSNGFIAEQAVLLWGINTPFVNTRKETYDVGIVLGGGLIHYDEKANKYSYGQSAERIMRALKLYNTGVIKKILVSGGSGSLFNPEYNEAELMQSFLLNSGIPGMDIIIDSVSKNIFPMVTTCYLPQQFI